MKRVDGFRDLKMRTLTDLIISSMNLIVQIEEGNLFNEVRTINEAIVNVPGLYEYATTRPEEVVQIYPFGNLFSTGQVMIPSREWHQFMKQYLFEATDVSPQVWFRFKNVNSTPGHLAIGHTVNKEKTFSTKSAIIIDCLIDNIRGLLEHNGYPVNTSQIKMALGDYGTSESRR